MRMICILVLLETSSVAGVVTGYISMGVLSDIDSMFGESLPVDIESELDEADFWYEKKPDLILIMEMLDKYK